MCTYKHNAINPNVADITKVHVSLSVMSINRDNPGQSAVYLPSIDESKSVNRILYARHFPHFVL